VIISAFFAAAPGYQVDCRAVLPTYNLAVFPRIWVSFFVDLRVFLKTCWLLVFGLILTEICLFFGLVFSDFCFSDCFFFKCDGNFLFQFAPIVLRHIGRVFVKIWSFWACFFEFATMLLI